MRFVKTFVMMTMMLAVFGVTPVAAQLFGFPDYALPSAGDTPATWLAGGYGRGLNDDSGKSDSFAGAIGRTTGRFSYLGAAGFVTGDDDEFTLGGALGVDLIQDADTPVQLTLQGGIGWMNVDVLDGSVTFLRFPVGLALKGDAGNGSTSVTPWIMPRLDILRSSGGGFDSDTETNFGVSGGVSVTGQNGFGAHAALDYLAAGDGVNPVGLGVGVHVILGQGN